MREPSIHIRETQFRKLLIEFGGSIDLDNLNKFMVKARSIACTSRSLYAPTKKVQEKAQTVSKGSLGDANLLADIIYSTRIQLKHLGVTKIKQSESQWAQVKELVPVINEFCQMHQLPPREGYIEFVKAGLNLMKTSTKKPNYQYCAKWMVQRADNILEIYTTKYAVRHDDTPEDTKEIHQYYIDKVADKTGIQRSYEHNPETYIHFIQAKLLADEMGSSYETFIDAQFYALEFCNGIPKPEDLVGDKATDRLIKYIGYTGIRLDSKQAQSHTINWDFMHDNNND